MRAQDQIDSLRNILDENATIFTITKWDLEQSRALRISIGEYAFYALLDEPKAAEFKKEYESEQ